MIIHQLFEMIKAGKDHSIDELKCQIVMDQRQNTDTWMQTDLFSKLYKNKRIKGAPPVGPWFFKNGPISLKDTLRPWSSKNGCLL